MTAPYSVRISSYILESRIVGQIMSIVNSFEAGELLLIRLTGTPYCALTVCVIATIV